MLPLGAGTGCLAGKPGHPVSINNKDNIMGKGQSEKKKQVAFKAKHPEGRGEFAKAKRAVRVAKRRAEVEKRGIEKANKKIR